MTGTVAQLISLVSYGNNYLRTGGKLPKDYFPDNSGFLFCQSVDFRIIRKAYFLSKSKEMTIAADPEAWFKHLKDQGCLQLKLYFEYSKDHNTTKDHKLAGFIGGGGSWLIEAVYPRYSNYWANRWLVNYPDDPDKRIWAVNYGLIIDHQRITRYGFDPVVIKEHLNDILVKIAYFAYDNNLEQWADTFHIALQALSDNDPPFSFYKDMLCAQNYSITARQVLAGACAAHVFGGMGSWNDLGFDTEEKNKQYESLSEQLYDAINRAILASVNSY